MASFKQIVAALRREEARVAKQLAGIQRAISSLEFGGAGTVAIRVGVPGVKRKRKLSAEARERIRQAQFRRWAKQKAGEKKK